VLPGSDAGAAPCKIGIVNPAALSRDLGTGPTDEVSGSSKSEPYFPLVCRRVLNRDITVPLTFVIFDLLRSDGVDLTSRPYLERREELEALKLDGHASTTCERFDDGRALFSAVCELGFEGVVAKNSSLFRRVYSAALDMGRAVSTRHSDNGSGYAEAIA